VKERPSSGRAMTWFRVRWDHESCHELWQTWRIRGVAGSLLEPLTNVRGSRALEECMNSAEGAAGGGADADSWARPSAKRTSSIRQHRPLRSRSVMRSAAHWPAS
jgi:hypothetical protein